ncbi:MAG: MoaD/ThiS family protein [Anaerolineae bacterium]
MPVFIEASETLRQVIPAGTTLERVQTVGEAISQLNLPRNLMPVVMVNGRLAHWNTEVRDGDVLKLLPPIAGG